MFSEASEQLRMALNGTRWYEDSGHSTKRKGTMKIKVSRDLLVKDLKGKVTELQTQINGNSDVKVLVQNFKNKLEEYYKARLAEAETLEACNTVAELAATSYRLRNQHNHYAPEYPQSKDMTHTQRDLDKLKATVKLLEMSGEDLVEVEDNSDYLTYLTDSPSSF